MLGMHFGNGFNLGKVETCSWFGWVGDLFWVCFFVVAEDVVVEGECSFYPVKCKMNVDIIYYIVES